MIDNEFELPNGWKWKTIKEISTVLGDGLHGTPSYSDNGDFYFINGNNLSDGKIEIKESTKRVSSEEANKYRKPLNDKTILVSINGTFGNTSFYNGEKVMLGKSACYFNVNDDIDKFYIRYCLKTQRFLNYAFKNATGSTIKNVGLKTMRDFPVPIPPLSEQQEIVAKIEELLSELDQGKQQLETARQQLKVYRQAVLKLAFEGKLTNAIQKEQKTQEGELPEGWKMVKIGELSPKVTVGFVGAMKDQYIDEGVPFLRGQNVRANRYDPDGLKFVSNEFHNSISKSKLFPGDILVVRSGNVGTSCVVPETLEEANCSDLVIIKKPENTNSFYIAYYLNSVVQSRILAQKVGVALGHFNTKTVEKFEIPLPPVEEQNQIVQEIESRLSVCDKVEETITQSLQQAETLRQSILKQAFEGKLVN